MLSRSLKSIGTYLLLFFLLCWLFLVAYLFSNHAIIPLVVLLILLVCPMIQKYRNFLQKSKRSKDRIQFYRNLSNKLILYGLKFVLLNLAFQSNTAFCQTDTLTSSQKDSITYFYLPYIIADLKDFDLLKQKSDLQAKQIKGLQSIANNQKNLSVRQSIKIEGYSNSLLKVQTNNYTLQTNLATTKKQRNLARLENWLWRGGAIFIIGKLFKLY
jgi:hypothetical protein